MNRTIEIFAELKRVNQKALIPYIMAGDPDLETTSRLVLEVARRGADLVELGVPFSDPIADGPTIQKASLRALAQGVTLNDILETVKMIRTSSDIPLVLMTYYNPVLAYGIECFCKDASLAGVDGLILPDLPPEEGIRLSKTCQLNGLSINFLVAPTSSTARIDLVNNHTTGFIYCVSLTGVTGTRTKLAEGVDKFMAHVRSRTDKPLGLGFGISSPDQAHEASLMADGIIVGSAIIKIIEEQSQNSNMVKLVGDYVQSLRDAIIRREN